jgi:hypothetical protein
MKVKSSIQGRLRQCGMQGETAPNGPIQRVIRPIQTTATTLSDLKTNG